MDADKVMRGLEIAPREREGRIELVVVSPQTQTRATFWLSDVVHDLVANARRAIDAGTFDTEKPRFEAMLDDLFAMASALHAAVHGPSASETGSTDP